LAGWGFSLGLSDPHQKQMTGMLGHPVAGNPIDLMFDAVYAHYGLPWQFWKNDTATEADLALAVKALVPLLDELDADVQAIGSCNYMTVEDGRLMGHNNDGKGVVEAIRKVKPLEGQRVVMLGE
jgi:shikimate dehydrogenase